MGTVYNPHFTMKAVLVLSVLASAFAAPDTRFLCSECVDEMHNLGFLVRAGAHDIRDYLAANYCPTVEEGQQDFCVEKLARYYIGMLDAIVHHYFMDGAVHVCQTMGVCDAFRSGRYTCEECVQGLEWVEAYIEDPIMIAEYVIYLEQNFCQDGWEGCKEHAIQDFPAMHNPWRSSSSPLRSAPSKRSAELPPRPSPHNKEQTFP